MTDAAVGSISHILKTAFKDVYEDKRERDEYFSSSNKASSESIADQVEEGGVVNFSAGDHSRVELSKAPKIRAVDTLELGDHHKHTLAQRAQEISRELEDKNLKADRLVQHLAEQRAIAKKLRIEEEEELKQQGIVIGQHIPPLPSKLDVDPAYLEQFGEFSSNILIARDLVSQNHENMMRRTGNMPISDQLEARRLERGKRLQDMESDAPHYLEQTASQNTRSAVTKVKFAESLRNHAQELTLKEPIVLKKRKKVLSGAERLENEAILKSINHKLNYLRNPRNDPGAVSKLLIKTKAQKSDGSNGAAVSVHSISHGAHQGGGSVTSEPTADSSSKHSSKTGKGGAQYSQCIVPNLSASPLFISEPKRILFNGFDIGNEYKKTVTFRNVSAVSRTFRVLPPSTSQFSMSPLMYPQNSKGGVVAPGMNVTAQITFFPDSLLEFDDHIVVETEGGFITVPILARRESPILTLPSILPIGACLVGDAMRTSIRCHNAGGPGKFQVISFDEFERGLGTSESTDCLRIAPFTIYPIEFGIDRNCHADFSIEYVPLELGESRGEFVILSDSGQSFKYTIIGNSLKTNIYICEINGTIVDPEDSTTVRDLYFNASYIGSHQTQKVHVANDTGLPVEYEWVWIDAKSKDIKLASVDKLIKREASDQNTMKVECQGGKSRHSNDPLGVSPDRSITSKTRALNFEASMPLPAPPGTTVVVSDTNSHSSGNGKKKGGRSVSSDQDTDMEMSFERYPFSDTGELSANVASYKGGFEIKPARGVMGVDGVVDFDVQFSPITTEEKAGKLVLLLRHMTLPALQANDQDLALANLKENAHGPHLRLRSWICEMAEVCPLYARWVEGSAAAVGAQPHPLTPQVVKIVNLKTLMSLAMNFCPGCTDENGNLTVLSSRLYYRVREILKFVDAYRNNEFVAEMDSDSSSLEGIKREELLKHLSFTVHVYSWHTSGDDDVVSVASSDNPKPLPPITIKPKGFSINDGIAIIDEADIEKDFSTTEKNELFHVWLNVENAVLLLGDEICDKLDLIIKHEVTDYIQSMERFDLPCLNLLAFGSGKPCTVVVDPPRILVGGSLSIGKQWRGIVTLRNSCNVMADIYIDADKLSVITHGHSEAYGQKDISNPIVKCEVNPSHVLLLPESEMALDVTMIVNAVGNYEIRIPLNPTNSLIYVDPVTVCVRTIGPRLRFEEPEIDIGLMSTGLEQRKTFTFTNESDVPLRFALSGSVDSQSVSAAMQPKNDSPSKTSSTTRKPSRRFPSRSVASGGGSAKNSADTDELSSPGGSGGGIMTSRSDISLMSKDSYTIENPTATVWYEPTAGIVRPNEQVTVTMVCMGGKLAQRLRGSIECNITDESGGLPLPMQLLPFRGEIQIPKAIVSPVNLNIGTVFENIKVPCAVKLQNLSNLPSKYKFERPGGDNPLYRLEFDGDVKAGTLGPKEILDIKMTFVANKQGIISDAIACKIFGVPHPIGFGISAVVKALSLEFIPLPDQTPAPTPLGLPTDCQYTGPVLLGDPAPIAPLIVGSNVKLYERKFVRFAIRNFSAIPAVFSVSPRLFGIGDAVELLNGDMGFSKTVHRSPQALLVANEDGEAKFHSEMGKDYVGASVKREEDKAYLTLGKGASYAIEPRSGTVAPWGVQVVTVYARNDMPGCFDDELLIDVENYRKITMPLSMTVEGCPLVVEKDTYGLTSKVDPETGAEKPLLLLGNLCKGEEAPERQFRIRNNGSVPTKISWKVRSATSKVNGPVKIEIKLNQDLTTKTKFLFWDDLAKETPFLVEPTSATIPSHGSQTFKVKLLRTSSVSSEKGLLTGSVILNGPAMDGNSNGENVPHIGSIGRSASQSILRKGNSSLTSLSAGNQYKLEVQLQGNVMNPAIRIDEHVVPVNYPDSVAPASATVFMRTHVPLLFENGAKNFDVCGKNIVLVNPLKANLAFTVSVEGPFLLRQGESVIQSDGNSTVATINTGKLSPKPVAMKSTMGCPFYLLPEATANVLVVLAPKKDLRDALKAGSGASTKSVKQRQETGNLVLSFWTGQSLRVPIKVELATPLITVSSPKINFGVCHAAKSCDGTILLSNPTDVIARWTVSHVPATDASFAGKTLKKTTTIRVSGFEERSAPVDDPDVFAIGPNAGMVEGPTISVTAAMQCPSKDFIRV